MKRILFFAIAVLFCGILQSQVFKDASDYSRTTVVTSNQDVFEPYTQKVLPFKDKFHVSLSKNTSGENVFTLLQDGTPESARSVALDSYFNVKDFAIYDEVLYFCGSVANNVSTTAFIAYENIGAMFSNDGSSTAYADSIKYTLIDNIPQDSIFSIDRLEVFYNQDSNEVVLTGIGKMYYGEPPYQTLGEDPFSGEFDTVDPMEYYLDFLMFYTIKEEQVITNNFDYILGANPVYAPANAMELFYVPNDTLSSCYFTKFADITLTDNRVYLIAINYSDITIDEPTHARYVDIISFDKLTRQQMANRITFPFEVHQEYGVKTTHLYNDEIAVALIECNDSIDYTKACVFRVFPQNSTYFTISNVSIFDSVYGKSYILDCEYLEKTKELIVLRNSIFNNQYEDVVFHLNIFGNITYPYNSLKYKINETSADYTFKWNDLQSSDMLNYTVCGMVADKNLVFYDMKFDALTKDISCFKSDNFKVESSPKFSVSTLPILERCTYSSLTPNVINGGYLFITYGFTPIYDALIQKYPIPVFYKNRMKINCLK